MESRYSINEELMSVCRPKMSMMFALKDLDSTNVFEARSMEFIIPT